MKTNQVRITDYDFPVPVIIDDVCLSPLDDMLETMILGSAHPWFLLDDVAQYQPDKSKQTSGLVHLYYRAETNWMSDYYGVVQCIPQYALERLGIPMPEYEVAQARGFLHMKDPNAHEHDGIHIDLPIKHVVCLYYVNDTDGDTFIFGKKKDDPVSMRITPKKNRAIIFNGDIYHASSSTRVDKRAIINFDLI